MTNWLVVGAGGMLGQDVMARLRESGRAVRAVDRTALDIADVAACDAAVRGADVVVNCAAWTAVDLAEEREAEAFVVNATGAANLARACAAVDAQLVHISTDYVFRGDATVPYSHDAPLDPVSAYGRTKAAGEWAVTAAHPRNLVLRTAWLYGAGGPSFPRTIARIAKEKGRVDVVDDQHGQPTWSRDVADLIVRLIDSGVAGGTFHATASGSATWWEFARAVVASAGLDPRIVNRTSSANMVRPAPRPAFSVLSHGSLQQAGVEPIGAWQDRWEQAAGEILTAGSL